MGIEQAPRKDGKEAARGLKRKTAEEERKVEKAKGSDLEKGAERFEERADSADRPAGG